MSQWEILHQANCQGVTFEIKKSYVNYASKHHVLLTVTDYTVTPKLQLFEVVFPRALDFRIKYFDSRKFHRIIELMEIVWLYTPLYFKNRIGYEKLEERIRNPRLRRFTNFLVQHYYSIMRYEHGHDGGVPSDYIDPELLDPTLFGPQLVPENFQDSKNILSWSYGKESQTSALVLDHLGIKYDKFRIFDHADAPMLEVQDTGTWLELYPEYQCFMGDIRRLWFFSPLERMATPFSIMPFEQPEGFRYSQIGKSMGWNMGITQKLLALFYMVLNDYKILFAGSEFERHLAPYRTIQGVHLHSDFRNSQFFYNYFNRISGLSQQIFSPITNFTQGSCIKTLLNHETRFNSCFASRGDDHYWCGKCPKCVRVSKILNQIAYLECIEDFDRYHNFLGLQPPAVYEAGFPLTEDESGTTRIPDGAPVFPELQAAFDRDNKLAYYQLYSSHLLNVWSKDTVDSIAEFAGLPLVHLSGYQDTMDDILSVRQPDPSMRF